KTISVASPLVDAALPDGSRIQLTLGTDIARRGSNFTIRKFTEEPLSPIHMLKFGTVDSKILAYLWMLTEFGKSTLIGGSTATGKTTLLNALSLFIKPELKIVTIEDTAELRLPHSHWVPQVARQAISESGGKKMGEVDMFDLLRESLRQRPDFILVGEVRGKEAYVLFQQIATGHPGIATIHADTIEKLVDRLITPPIELSPSLLENLDVIIFLVRIKYGNKYVRKISSILEVTGFDREKNAPVTNEVFKWDPVNDKFVTVNPSIVLRKISCSTGINEAAIQKDIGKRISILDWLAVKNFTDYRIFANVMKMYYTRQNRLEEIMER
ncbi:MAG: type II/IV secretion system ATPase subunit, partial [Rectinemataceae bacterium]|nr:type II/IV secretion system ATPase subunit [Rectinemataceae bacterium]